MRRLLIALGCLLVVLFLGVACASSREESRTIEPSTRNLASLPAIETPSVEYQQDTKASPDWQTFQLVPGKSEARYEVGEELTFLGIDYNLAVGVTRDVEGEVNFILRDDEVELGHNRFQVNLKALVSDDKRRDRRIREQWLESNIYPVAEFIAFPDQRFSRGDPGVAVWRFDLAGDMTIRENTRPVVLNVVMTLDETTISGEASAKLRMTDFGFGPPASFGFFKVKNDVRIVIEFSADKISP